MLSLISNEVFKPLIRRAGTALGGILLGAGVTASQTDVIVSSLIALLLVSVDLLASAAERRKG